MTLLHNNKFNMSFIKGIDLVGNEINEKETNSL